MEAIRFRHLALVFENVELTDLVKNPDLGEGLLFYGETKHEDLSEDSRLVQRLLDATDNNKEHEDVLDSIFAMAKLYGPLDKRYLEYRNYGKYGQCLFETLSLWRGCLKRWGELLRNANSDDREEILVNPNPGEAWRYSKTFEHLPTVGITTSRNLEPLFAERRIVAAEMRDQLQFSIDKEEPFVQIETFKARGYFECALALSGRKVIKQCKRCKQFFDLTHERERGKRWNYCDTCRGSHRIAKYRALQDIKTALAQTDKIEIRALKRKRKDKNAVEEAINRAIAEKVCYREGDALLRLSTRLTGN